jgi:hypothetical protein
MLSLCLSVHIYLHVWSAWVVIVCIEFYYLVGLIVLCSIYVFYSVARVSDRLRQVRNTYKSQNNQKNAED